MINVFIDTSVFVAEGFVKGKCIATLFDAAQSEMIHILMPDITEHEIRCHLHEEVEKNNGGKFADRIIDMPNQVIVFTHHVVFMKMMPSHFKYGGYNSWKDMRRMSPTMVAVIDELEIQYGKLSSRATHVSGLSTIVPLELTELRNIYNKLIAL